MNSLNLVFYRVLRGQDIQVGTIDPIDAGVEGCRLTAASGPGHKDDAVGLPDEPVHDCVLARAEAQVRQIEQDARLVQESHHDALVAAACGNSANANVEALAGY